MKLTHPITRVMIAVIGQLEKNLPRGGGYVFSFLKKYPFRMVVMTVRTDSFPLIVDEKPHVKAKSIHPLGNEEEKAVAVHDALIHRSMLNVLPLATVSRSSDSLFFFLQRKECVVQNRSKQQGVKRIKPTVMFFCCCLP